MLELKFIIMVLCLSGSFFKFRPNMIISGIVEIENGKIIGNRKDNYVEFLGIPYAEPPINELRFAPPQKYSQKWDIVKEFKNYSDVCAQYDHFGYHFHGSEDCLTLNVFVPQSVLNSNILVPVIFYIHGGAFMFGGGKLYGPKYLMQSENVILVTVNYRLGVLGFLSTEDKVIPGNFGLKDQVEALKWIQTNIEAFKGDPRKVTITGFSAGGASVHLHYLSKVSDDLFNNGISHSGNALDPWVMMEKGKEKTYELAEAMNCSNENHHKILECLRKIPARNLALFASHYQPFLYNPFSPFGVSVEKDHDGAFLIEQPLKSLKKGNIRKVNWILTQVQDEGLYPASEFYDDNNLKTINDQWMSLAPFLFDYNSTTDDQDFKNSLSKKIRKNYLQNKVISKETFPELLQIFTDRLFHSGAMTSLQLHSAYAPSYFYLFRYQKPLNDSLGIGHGDDVFLIYENLDEPNELEGTETIQMSSLLMNFYGNFSLKNTPVFGAQELERVEPKNVRCLEIFSPSNFSIVQKNNIGNIYFWKSLNIEE